MGTSGKSCPKQKASIMNKQQQKVVDQIKLIDASYEFTKGSVQLLRAHLKSLQPAMDKAGDDRETRQSVASNMTSANATIKTGGAKFADIRGSIITDMESGETIRGRVKANVWQLVTSDLKIQTGKVDGKTIHTIGATLTPRQVMTRSATPVAVKGEFHQTFSAIQLDAMRDLITSTAGTIYSESQKKERTAWIRQKESTFNTALRASCADHDLDTVSMASAGTGDAKECYFKVTAQKDQVAEKDKTKAVKAREGKEKLATATAGKVLDSVTILEALTTVSDAYVKSGRVTLNDAMVALDKIHGKYKALQAKEAKAHAKAHAQDLATVARAKAA
jgi:hypothetical protein